MMQKKNDLKLPQIKKTHKESSTLLSKTITDSSCTPKLRPASSSKVQDLQKKLFNKIQDYEVGSKKKILKKSTKNNKQALNDQSANTESKLKYEQMQKLMPGLYSKLVEVKKGNYMSQQLIGSIQSTIQPKQQQTNTKRESIQSSFQQLQSSIQTPFITANEQDLLSLEEMDKIFKDYSLLEGLAPTTSIKDMKQINDNLLCSEKDIDDIKKSMEGLIKSVGMEYIRQIENDQEYRFSE